MEALKKILTGFCAGYMAIGAIILKLITFIANSIVWIIGIIVAFKILSLLL